MPAEDDDVVASSSSSTSSSWPVTAASRVRVEAEECPGHPPRRYCRLYHVAAAGTIVLLPCDGDDDDNGGDEEEDEDDGDEGRTNNELLRHFAVHRHAIVSSEWDPFRS